MTTTKASPRVVSKVLVTPVGMQCNMACEYCCNQFCSDFVPRPVVTMPLGLLDRLYEGLTEVASPRCTIIWHGGEPTFAGPAYLRSAIEHQAILRQRGIVVQNCLQTNATRLTDEWCELFRQYGVRPSISLDGPPTFHDRYRRTRSGHPTYGRARRGLDLLRKHDVRHGLLVVVTRSMVPHADQVFDWLQSEEIRHVDLLPCFEPELIVDGRQHLSPTPDEYGRFMTDLFDRWWLNDDPGLDIRTFRDVLRSLVGGQPYVCSWRGSCSWIVSVNERGEVYPCARYHGLPDTSLGSLTTDTLSDLIRGRKHQELRLRMESGQQDCRTCRWLSACGGGCPFARYALRQDFSSPYYYCRSRQLMFEHISRRVEEASV